MSFIYCILYWEVNRLIMIWARKRWPLQTETSKRLNRQIAAQLGFTLLSANVLDGCLYSLLASEQNFTKNLIMGNAASLYNVGLTIAIYESIYFFVQAKKSTIESEKLKRENMQSQLDTLRNQVNPHFLFNSLNTLSSIIHEEPDLAVDFVQKLSKVYRYILEIREKDLISLKEELRCIEAYKFLLGIRFGKNFSYEHHIPKEKLDHYLAPLSLQILMENAIKHNIISRKKPLKIKLSITEEGNLLVQNNLQKKKLSVSSTKMGLQNIKSRYEILTKQEVQVWEDEQFFNVILPLIRIDMYEGSNN